jgi:hypothetical protein
LWLAVAQEDQHQGPQEGETPLNAKLSQRFRDAVQFLRAGRRNVAEVKWRKAKESFGDAAA